MTSHKLEDQGSGEQAVDLCGECCSLLIGEGEVEGFMGGGVLVEGAAMEHVCD